MKLTIVLKVSLFLIILGFLASCSSSQPAYSYKSAVPDHCGFQEYKKPSNKKRTEAPPSKTTPIGGNYKVRN